MPGNMSDSEPRSFSGARFWRWYALAWLDLAGLYSVVFLITGQDSVIKAVTGAVVYVIPMAVLGVVALAVFRRFDWSTVQRASFVVTLVALGVVYGIATAGLNHGMFRAL